MSGLLNSSLNGSASSVSEAAGRSFASAFSPQSGVASPAFYHAGNIQGLHNTYGSYNVPNVPGALTSRNSTLNNINIPSGGIQQSTESLSSGRFASNNLPVALSPMSHGSSHGHSGVVNRGGVSVVGTPGYSGSTAGIGGSIPGILSSSASISNRSTVPGMGVSPIFGNANPRIASSVGSIVGGGNTGRGIGSGGGLSMPGLSSRLNIMSNSGSGNLGVQGQGRLMSGVLQQASPQVMSMLGNTYPTAVNNLSSMGMFNDVNSNDAPFDINDFPQLTSRPNSAGGAHGQLGSLRKQSLGVSPIVQQNQEFSIQNEDFPALPGFKGSNADYAMDLHQREQQLHDSTVSLMQSQHFSAQMGNSAGFALGGAYSSHRPQQQHQHLPPVSTQDLLHLNASARFASSHPTYHSQASAPPGIGLRQPMNAPNSSYEQMLHHQQQQYHQNQQSLRVPPMNHPFRDQGLKSIQSPPHDPFGLLGLLSVIRMSDPDLTSIALGIDLTTLGLNLSSAENLHKNFISPWSDEPSKGVPEFNVPRCYYAKAPPPLHPLYFSKFQLETLFYVFYSMPRDEAQLHAANELYNRGWIYHREHKLWFIRVPNMDPLVKTGAYERGSYLCFDPNSWETARKDNFVVHYEMLEKRPSLGQH